MIKRVVSFAAVLCAGVAMSGCVDNQLPPCPSVRVDNATARMTQFREGNGRDVSDVEYQAEVLAYHGSCKFSDEGVEVQMDLDFSVATGPAVKKGPANVYYFVAVPQLFPDPKGKRVFQLRYDLPATPGVKTKVSESDIRIFIPLKKDQPAASFDVYVGMQLTDAQLNYNRTPASR